MERMGNSHFRTNKKLSAKEYKMKRVGAKAAKAAERFESKGEMLDENALSIN